MARFAIEQRYYGDEYCIMGEVVKAIMQNPAWEHAEDLDTIRELETIRQTLIETEKIKQNGDCSMTGGSYRQRNRRYKRRNARIDRGEGMCRGAA